MGQLLHSFTYPSAPCQPLMCLPHHLPALAHAFQVTRLSDSVGTALDVRFADPGCCQRADQPPREVDAWRCSTDPLAVERGIGR